jgi:hypothetical protein
MTRRLVGLSLLVIVSLAVVARGADEEPKDPAEKHSYWMKKKLEWSQSLLAGLAKADWEKMGKDARAMRALSKIEGRFRRTDQAEYRAQLAVFDQANNELVKSIGDENIDASTLAYMHLVHSCVNCHKLLQQEMKTKLPK